MKQIAIIILLLTAVFSVNAQTNNLPNNLYAAGAAWNQSGNSPVAGSALYARLVSQESKTYAFTVVDILPISKKPFTVTTNIGVGVAQKAFNLYGVSFYVPASAGVSITDANTGWAWTGGVLADYQLKKGGKLTNLHFQPNVRWVKSSVSNGSSYQLIPGAWLGYSF
jgi:hypothetical protein